LVRVKRPWKNRARKWDYDDTELRIKLRERFPKNLPRFKFRGRAKRSLANSLTKNRNVRARDNIHIHISVDRDPRVNRSLKTESRPFRSTFYTRLNCRLIVHAFEKRAANNNLPKLCARVFRRWWTDAPGISRTAVKKRRNRPNNWKSSRPTPPDVPSK